MQLKKINDEMLLRMIQEHRPQKEIARIMKVSEPAISRRLRKLLPQPESILNRHDLTETQKRFCLKKAQGLSNSQAVIQSGYNVSSPQSAKSVATQLMQKEEIKKTIAELLEECGLSKSYRVQRLKAHVDNPVDGNISLKALDMSFRLDASYPPARNINLNASTPIEPIDLETLEALFANNNEDELQK